MKRDRVTELAVASSDTPTVRADQVSAQYAQVAALRHIATRTRRALAPVDPAPVFRARLRDGLLTAAQHQQAPPLLVHSPAGRSWGWQIAAVLLGSAIGFIALAWHIRRTQRTSPTTAR